MTWTRKEAAAGFEEDRERYKAELANLLASGLTAGHPLVDRLIKRIETVNRVLRGGTDGPADPARP